MVWSSWQLEQVHGDDILTTWFYSPGNVVVQRGNPFSQISWKSLMSLGPDSASWCKITFSLHINFESSTLNHLHGSSNIFQLFIFFPTSIIHGFLRDCIVVFLYSSQKTLSLQWLSHCSFLSSMSPPHHLSCLGVLEWPLGWDNVARGSLGLVGVFPHTGLCYLIGIASRNSPAAHIPLPSTVVT